MSIDDESTKPFAAGVMVGDTTKHIKVICPSRAPMQKYPDVMVVMDDVAADGFLISYDKIFGGKDLSDKDRDNAGIGKETTIDRTLRLLYVTCSR